APGRDETSSGACATRSATTRPGTARSRSPARAAGSSGWRRSRPRPRGSLASASSADTKSRSRRRRRRSRWRAEGWGRGRRARGPGGAALAVDRVAFSQAVHDRVTSHPAIAVVRGEVTGLESPGIVATGPLTSEALAGAIARRLDASALAFFDAIAPIVSADSLDTACLFRASRYGKGSGDDYWNAPLTEAQYDEFVTALRTGAQYPPHHEFDPTANS